MSQTIWLFGPSACLDYSKLSTTAQCHLDRRTHLKHRRPLRPPKTAQRRLQAAQVIELLNGLDHLVSWTIRLPGLALSVKDYSRPSRRSETSETSEASRTA